MIPTFVITLREGVEAALIVGIIAAFLVKEGRRDALRQMWIGVGIAVALCVGVAAVLEVIGQDLPQKQQDGLPTVIEVMVYLLYAVPMTLYVLWPSQLRLRPRRVGAGRQAGPAGNPA